MRSHRCAAVPARTGSGVGAEDGGCHTNPGRSSMHGNPWPVAAQVVEVVVVAEVAVAADAAAAASSSSSSGRRVTVAVNVSAGAGPMMCCFGG